MTSRTWTLVAVVLSALAAGTGCSSSSSGGGVPSCQGNAGTSGAGSAACNTCLSGKCGSQLSSVEGACSAYVSCYDGCQCTDTACLTGCQAKIDSSCQNAYAPLVSCLQQSCSADCAGGSPADAGTGG